MTEQLRAAASLGAAPEAANAPPHDTTAPGDPVPGGGGAPDTRHRCSDTGARRPEDTLSVPGQTPPVCDARCPTTPREIPTGRPSAWAVPLRLLRGCEARSEPLLRRERCHHRNVRACGAPRLDRVDTAWCTLTPNVHEAACTIPVVECSQGPFECSVYSSYSN